MTEETDPQRTHVDGQEKARFLLDVVINGVAHFAAQIRGLLVLPIISIGLSVADYGIWSQLSSTSLLLLPILVLGLDQAAVRYLPGMEAKDNFANAFYGMFLCIVCACGFALLLLWSFRMTLSHLLFGDDKHADFVCLLGLLVCGQVVFRFLLNYWRVVRKVAVHAVIRTSMEVSLVTGLFVVIVLAQLELVAGVVYWVILQWIFAVALLAIVLRVQPPLWSLRQLVIRPYLQYAAPLILYVVANWLITSSNRYYIVSHFGLSEVGMYAAASSLGGIATSVKIPLNFVLLPALSKFWDENNKDAVRDYTERVMGLYFALAVPLVVVLIAAAPLLLELFANISLASGRIVLGLVGVAFLLAGLDQFFRNIMMLQERTGRLVMLLVPIALLGLCLNHILIPTFGIVGAATALLATMGIKAIALYVRSRQDFRYSVNLPLLWRAAVASVPLALIMWAVPPRTLWMLLLAVLVGGVVYVVCMSLLGAISSETLKLTLVHLRSTCARLTART